MQKVFPCSKIIIDMSFISDLIIIEFEMKTYQDNVFANFICHGKPWLHSIKNMA